MWKKDYSQIVVHMVLQNQLFSEEIYRHSKSGSKFNTKFNYQTPHSISNNKSKRRIFNTIQQTFGGVDILLYLDGSRCDQIFKDIPTLAIVSQMMENNFVAPIYAISCALPILRACKGQVLVMGDTSGLFKVIYHIFIHFTHE